MSPLVRYLTAASAALLLVLVGVVVGLMLRGKTTGPAPELAKKDEPPVAKEGQEVTRTALPDPPPPPKPVVSPDRIRSTLQPGKTYGTRTKGTVNVTGEDKDWGFGVVVNINYAFEAEIDREIESNDGATIVELRHFRTVRSVKLNSTVKDVRIDLGAARVPLFAGLAGLSTFWPAAGGLVTTIKVVEGRSLLPVIKAFPLLGSPEDLSGLNEQSARLVTQVNGLEGKKVRLTYRDGKGVESMRAVQGEMTPQEYHWHRASSLLSDALIFPDQDIKMDSPWAVDGNNFANLIDPNLLALTSGQVTLKRGGDQTIDGKVCRRLDIAGGRLNLDDRQQGEGRIGYFDPAGAMYFSPADQAIIRAELRGKGELTRFSKNHLLFESRMRRQPDLEVVYECRVVDSKAR